MVYHDNAGMVVMAGEMIMGGSQPAGMGNNFTLSSMGGVGNNGFQWPSVRGTAIPGLTGGTGGAPGGFWGQSEGGGGGVPRMPQMPSWPSGGAGNGMPQGWGGMLGGGQQGFQQGLMGLWQMINGQGSGFSMNGSGGNNASGMQTLMSMAGSAGNNAMSAAGMPGGFNSNGSAYR